MGGCKCRSPGIKSSGGAVLLPAGEGATDECSIDVSRAANLRSDPAAVWLPALSHCAGSFMPQSLGEATQWCCFSASIRTTYVLAGNEPEARQLNAALYLRPVKSATTCVPPSSSMISEVVWSSRIHRTLLQEIWKCKRHARLLESKLIGVQPMELWLVARSMAGMRLMQGACAHYVR